MADICWPKTDLGTRFLLACVASVSVRFRSKEQGTRVKERAKNGMSKRAGRGWGRKDGNLLPSPPLPPPSSFIFWLSFHFSRGQNRKSHSSVFLCSETKRKLLLRRLHLSHTPILPMPLRIHATESYSSTGMKNSSRPSCRQVLYSRQHLDFFNFFRSPTRTSLFCSNIWKA